MLVLFVTPWLRTFNQCWRWLRRHCRFHCAASFSRPWCAIIIIIYIFWPSFSKTLKPLGLWWGTAWNTSLSTTKFVLQWGDCKWIVYIWDMKDEMYEQINKWMIKHSTLGKERNNKKKKDVDTMLWQNRSPIESYSTFFIPLLKRQPILYAYHGIKFKTDIIYLLYSHFLLMTIENCLSVSFYPFHLSHPFSFHFHPLLQQEICGCTDNKTNVHKWHVKSMSTGNWCSNNIFKMFIYRPWTRVSSWDPYNISVSFLKDNIIL